MFHRTSDEIWDIDATTATIIKMNAAKMDRSTMICETMAIMDVRIAAVLVVALEIKEAAIADKETELIEHSWWAMKN